ncbi:oligoendopeptidase F [Alteribacillus iranensis]|uniref:Oligopeptidase F n=1 Tax=Alteribacillus iranensis TaxID=930128 RepID=A0A1I2D5C2_9BACI|nr:oligoendopeptidase F [Alteribacillus iranensis]SFE75716.1 oligoendopeptidase F [Alteribacillus iranensis]
MAGQQRKSRDQIPENQTWNLKDMFETREEWETELKAVQKDVSQVTDWKGKVGDEAKGLLECLEAKEGLMKRITRVTMYADLQQSVDNTNPAYQEDAARAADAAALIQANLAFVETEIMALSRDTIDRYITEAQGLQAFQKYLNDLQARKSHTLNEETEKVLASLGPVLNAPYTIYNRGKLSDMQFESFIDDKGEEKPLSFASYISQYSASPSKTVRKNAYDAFNRTLEQYKNTFAATYATQVNQEVTMARLRNYDSVTDMLLDEQHVTKEMYHNQLDVTFEELAPHMRKFAELKKRVLGLDELEYSDLKAPLDPDLEIETSYEDAAETVQEALQVMGDEYSQIIGRAFKEGWVDYADNIGKSTGAFCSSPYGIHPYVLMTWPGSMRGAFTLAHELGHGAHFYMAEQHQRLTNTRPSRYFVEAPSTMNEMLLAHHLLSKSNDEKTRRWVLLQLLGTYYHNFVTHLLEGELQRRVYDLAEQGEPITANVLSNEKKDVLQTFWGDTVTIDDGAGLVWMHQPHYYMGLYPYTYSAGLTVSTLVSQDIMKEGTPAADRWIDVLKAGGSLPPLELIKKAGIDMSQPQPIQEAVSYVGSIITELEKSYS